MSDGFLKFIKDVAARLRAISGSVRGYSTPKDLLGDAWMVAAKIGERRGSPVNFSDPADQELVLNRVYWSAKGQRDWRLSSAQSIDDSTDGGLPLAERLPALATLTPLEALLQKEEAAHDVKRVARTYSQAAAYYIALVNFKNGHADLCARLMISSRALGQRIGNAAESVTRQDSVFDGVETIPRDFLPKQGREVVGTLNDAAVAWEQTELQL